jgi:hypothetical protein
MTFQLRADENDFKFHIIFKYDMKMSSDMLLFQNAAVRISSAAN